LKGELPLKTTRTELDEVIIVEPEVFSDPRGIFYESYVQNRYQDLGIVDEFVQDNHSISKKNVLRGLHYQVGKAQAKLVRVGFGEVFDVAVDIRKNSPSFGKWVGVRLSAENKKQMYIPAGFAHGFCALTENAEVLYKCSAYYSAKDDRGILWDDEDIAIDWPVKDPILSEKDRNNPKLKDI